METALEISQRAVQHGRSVAGAIEARARCLSFSAFVGAVWVGVVLGDGPLVVRQDINPKPLLGVHVGVGAGGMIDANQHQEGIKGHGGEGVRGHAVDFAIEIEGHDGDASGEMSHGFAEVGGIQSHIPKERKRLHYHAAALYDSIDCGPQRNYVRLTETT